MMIHFNVRDNNDDI